MISMRVMYNLVPSDEPLAYVTGWQDGFNGADRQTIVGTRGGRNDQIEYAHGYIAGKATRDGHCGMPDWATDVVVTNLEQNKEVGDV